MARISASRIALLLSLLAALAAVAIGFATGADNTETLAADCATCANPGIDRDDDETSLLQRPGAAVVPTTGQWPIKIPLRRESVPVVRNGKVVSHKTSYSGAMALGTPKQDFRVVFDTGSGHVVVPASSCESETCQEHSRYNLLASKTATAINVDGTKVPADELCDQVTIGFATGKVLGEFARDQVCLGGASKDEAEMCLEASVVMAVEMTTQPFKDFQFDGIFGLGLDALAVSNEFSILRNIAGAGIAGVETTFGMFLAEDDMSGELALGGHNSKRLLTKLHWAPVADVKQGHWQINIQEVRIGNRSLDLCKDGSCRGVVDTGTSHLGVPGTVLRDFHQSLSVAGSKDQDCARVDAPPIELVIDGFTLNLTPKNYMRPLSVPSDLISPGGKNVLSTMLQSITSLVAPAASDNTHTCSPKIMPVNLPAPLGPNLFILGEPLLRRYYTVYDWQAARIGFGLAAIEQNRQALGLSSGSEQEQSEDTYSFMQVTLTVSVSVRHRRGVRKSAVTMEHGLPLLA